MITMVICTRSILTYIVYGNAIVKFCHNEQTASIVPRSVRFAAKKNKAIEDIRLFLRGCLCI